MIKQVFKTMVAFLAVATMTIGPAWGQNSSTSSLVFSEAYGTGGATADDEVEWTVTSDGTESNYDGTKGIHYGTSKAQVQYMQLSTSDIIGTITQVKVNASTANNVDATIGVTVGGAAFGGNAQSLSSSATDYTFTGSATGAIVVRLEKPSAATGALYVKSIEVTYTPASVGGSTPEPMQTTYNVTFGGFSESEMNTTVNVTSLPQTFTQIGNDALYPWTVISTSGNMFYGATVTSGGEGKVSVSVPNIDEMSITVTGPFEGTATIHVTGEDDENRDISCDITVSCVAVGGGSTPEPPAPAVPHTVRFASGNDGWTVTDVDSARSATAPAVLQNVMAGDSLVVTAPATLDRKVKSVKAVKYVPPAATVSTAPTATAGIIEAGSTTALVNAGAANGGTMMYAVTTTNAQPASTADFSSTRPTAEGRAAGTYYVWYYVDADANHSDSEIAGSVSVTLAVMTTVTWNSTNVFNSANWQDAIGAWQSGSLTYEGITISKPTTGLSAFYPYDLPEQRGRLVCYGDDNDHDSFTFTAPSGKKFCKIEIINNEGITFDEYGDWTEGENNNIVWSGTAANAVTLGTVYTAAGNLNSIVFKLIDAQ